VKHEDEHERRAREHVRGKKTSRNGTGGRQSPATEEYPEEKRGDAYEAPADRLGAEGKAEAPEEAPSPLAFRWAPP